MLSRSSTLCWTKAARRLVVDGNSNGITNGNINGNDRTGNISGNSIGNIKGNNRTGNVNSSGNGMSTVSPTISSAPTEMVAMCSWRKPQIQRKTLGNINCSISGSTSGYRNDGIYDTIHGFINGSRNGNTKR